MIRHPFWLSTEGESFEEGLSYHGHADEIDRVIFERDFKVSYKPQFYHHTVIR